MSNPELLMQLRLDQSQRDGEHHPTSHSRWLWGAGIAGAVVLAGTVGVWLLFPPPAITAQPTTAVAASASNPAASTGPAGAVLQATGYVTARRQATVSSQVTGTLVEVLIEEGDRVEQGQVLARLESAGQLAAMKAARAGALAADAQTLQVAAQVEQAIRSADRKTLLARQQLVSRQEAEQAGVEVKVLQAQLHAAQRQAEAMQAQAKMAEVAIDYTVIRAPFSGMVTRKAAQVGEIISPQSTGGGFTRSGVGTIVDMDSLEVDVDVNEAYIGRVQAGMSAEIVLDAYPDWQMPAQVIAIVPTADRAKATIKVRVGFEQKDPRIVPDMGVRVSFFETRKD